MAQCCEMESVLGLIVKHLDASVDIKRKTIGQLLNKIQKLLLARSDEKWKESLQIIGRAINRRNHAVHCSVTIGSSWAPYATGGGEWAPVISLVGIEEYDEIDLRHDLALQQDATISAATSSLNAASLTPHVEPALAICSATRLRRPFAAANSQPDVLTGAHAARPRTVQ